MWVFGMRELDGRLNQSPARLSLSTPQKETEKKKEKEEKNPPQSYYRGGHGGFPPPFFTVSFRPIERVGFQNFRQTSGWNSKSCCCKTASLPAQKGPDSLLSPSLPFSLSADKSVKDSCMRDRE
mmetsp:Transcript_26214/g.51476  ORF Transcript_26214/g.51476 Transcript_26214/m.51476 type:complete len:124 (-) Transcript_26214:1642-2013(-)